MLSPAEAHSKEALKIPPRRKGKGKLLRNELAAENYIYGAVSQAFQGFWQGNHLRRSLAGGGNRQRFKTG